MPPLKLYGELATWWPLFSPPEEYADEVAFFLQVLPDSGTPQSRTMVEFGSGGGNNAFHLKKHYAMTLVDISPDMLAVSRAINPECEHLAGDMRSVRLGRVFDIVFIHDAIMYMTTEADLRQAFATAFAHCRPGGTALFVPDHVRENYESKTSQGGRDGEGRAIRYLEWQFDPDTSDSTYMLHLVLMLREENAVHIEHDCHEFGLFSRSDWLRLLGETGFQAKYLTDQYNRDVFVAMKPNT